MILFSATFCFIFLFLSSVPIFHYIFFESFLFFMYSSTLCTSNRLDSWVIHGTISRSNWLNRTTSAERLGRRAYVFGLNRFACSVGATERAHNTWINSIRWIDGTIASTLWFLDSAPHPEPIGKFTIPTNSIFFRCNTLILEKKTRRNALTLQRWCMELCQHSEIKHECAAHFYVEKKVHELWQSLMHTHNTQVCIEYWKRDDFWLE